MDDVCFLMKIAQFFLLIFPSPALSFWTKTGIKPSFFAYIIYKGRTSGERRGFWMHKRKKATEGEKVLAAIYAIQLELRRAQAGFQDETDEALIDSYIYEIISLHKKYEYYLRRAKELGLAAAGCAKIS